MNNILLYQQTLDPQVGQALLDEHKSVIDSNIRKWSGTLPPSVIRAQARTLALKAFETFDPSKGANIHTHLFNHLSKLSRINYENQNTVKMPEHQIMEISNFHGSVNFLKDKLGREPELPELADYMGMPEVHVARISKNLRKEYLSEGSDNPSFQTINIGANDERDTEIKDAIRSLPIKDRQVFNLISGGASPADLGVSLKLRPYEVSRLKSRIAKHFGGING